MKYWIVTVAVLICSCHALLPDIKLDFTPSLVGDELLIPHSQLVLTNASYAIGQQTDDLWRFDWRVDVENPAGWDDTATVAAIFRDAGGKTIASDNRVDVDFAAHSTTTVTGFIYLAPAQGQLVASIQAGAY